MEGFLYRLQRICKILNYLSGVNIVFVDAKQHRTVQYIINDIPAPLKNYIGSAENSYEAFATITADADYDIRLFSDPFHLSYMSSSVFEKDEYLGCIIVGPFLLEEPNSIMIQDVILVTDFPISLRSILKQYYRSITILNRYKVEVISECLFSMVHTFSFMPDIHPRVKEENIPPTKEHDMLSDGIKQNPNLYLDMIQKTYDKENELMHAVESGNYQASEKILTEYGFLNRFLNRVPNDPLRSYKNVTFVFNTLLRKAAENGGVHPIYIDSVSGKFAINIEKVTSMQQMTTLNQEMVFEYCELVNNCALKKYTRFMRKLIEYIRLNLDRNLSLEVLSKVMDMSPTGISRRFKAETGQSIIDFIHESRINESIKLMMNEKYNISEIALKVGFDDVNYFTKVFKKHQHVTPTAYRKSHGHSDTVT